MKKKGGGGGVGHVFAHVFDVLLRYVDLDLFSMHIKKTPVVAGVCTFACQHESLSGLCMGVMLILYFSHSWKFLKEKKSKLGPMPPLLALSLSEGYSQLRPIIRLRRVPGPARLVGLFPLSLLFVCFLFYVSFLQ